MATKPKRPCNRVGCRNLTTQRFCEEHRQQDQRDRDRYRGSAHERGYDSRWRRASKRFLRENPLCVRCDTNGFVRASEVTDHIVPHKGDMELFWDRDNWQALCKRCHDIKTAREDGGFGNRENYHKMG